MIHRSCVALVLMFASGLAESIEAAQSSGSAARLRMTAPGEHSSVQGAWRAGEGFGAASASIGDLDGNGVVDLVVGSPEASSGGALTILFLKSDGSLLRSRRIEAGSAGFDVRLSEHARFGSAVASLGDLDQDGRLELAVGAPGHPSSPIRGSVWVLSIDARGLVQSQRRLWLPNPYASAITPVAAEPLPGFRPAVQERAPASRPPASPRPLARSGYDGFGSSLCAVGDLDGDGHTELVVGAPWDRGGNREGDGEGESDGAGGAAHGRGALWVLSLDEEATIREQYKINDTQGLFGGALLDGDHFGHSLANLGDLDGDGRPELAVGAPGSYDAQGAVWVLFLGRQGGVRRFARLDPPGRSLWRDQGLPAGRFGASLAGLGDYDGDGTGDLAVGATQGGARGQGAVWLLLLRRDGSALAQQQLGAQDAGWDLDLPSAAGFGSSMALVDDVDGNGQPDLVVGAVASEGPRAQQGPLWLVPMERCFAASISLREGAASNPRILSSPDLPRRGNPWSVVLDCSGMGLGMGAVLGRTRAAEGVFTEAGEVLVDLSPSSYAFLLQAPHQSEALNFTLQLPSDTASCNMVLFVQGLCSSSQGARFSNALDLIIGG